jgi:hypothetical protein
VEGAKWWGFQKWDLENLMPIIGHIDYQSISMATNGNIFKGMLHKV